MTGLNTRHSPPYTPPKQEENQKNLKEKIRSAGDTNQKLTSLPYQAHINSSEHQKVQNTGETSSPWNRTFHWW